jgi:homopolymeric O-antigen transport system ATP-binding protein
MSNIVISVEHLTKKYDLGVIGTGTLSRDLERWWARIRHRPDPYTKIGEEDAFNRFGETILALDDVNFRVHRGEALGIIGRNGAGKSTLLKILSRVTAPTAGKVKVKGRIGSLLEVGTGFHPELTGRENVFLNGAILGMKKVEVQRKFDEIVDFAGVEKFIDTPVKRYSSGMYVRLAFAVAAHLETEILIVDEVLAVGDAEFQKKCLGKMGNVADEGRTVLFVSHNMTAIQNLCNKALWINNGQIQKEGLPKEIIDSYLSIYRKSNEPRINLLDFPRGRYSSETIFEEVCLYKDETLSSVFNTGDNFKLETIISIGPDQLSNVSFGFDIKDKTDRIIFASNMQQYKLYIPVKKKNRYKLGFRVPSLCLNPGHYSVSLYIGNGTNNDIDVVHDAVGFDMLWKNEHEILPPHSYWGPLSIPVEWDWEIE